MRRRTNGEAEARDSRRRNCRGVDMVMGGWELSLVFNFIMVQEGHRGTRRFTYRAIHSVSCPDVHTRLFLPSLHRLSVRMIKYASRALHSMLRAQHVLYYTENEFYLGAVDMSSYKCMISFLATSKRACRGAAPV